MRLIKDMLEVDRFPAFLLEMRVEGRKELRHKPFDIRVVRRQTNLSDLVVYQPKDLHLKRTIVAQICPCLPLRGLHKSWW